MATEKIDYVALLSELEAKKAALEVSIASIRSALALGVLGQAVEGVEVAQAGTAGIENGVPMDLPRGALHGKSIPQAIKLYLSAVKKRQTNKQITDALKEHGVASTGKLEQVVTGSLNRMRGKEVLRFDDGWGLTSWYPDTFRSKITEGSSKVAKTGKAKRKSKKQSAAAPTPAKSEPVKTVGTQERILQLLRSKPNTEFSSQDVTNQLSLRPQTAPFVLGKLEYKKLIEKTASGKFRALASKVHEMTAAV